MVERSDIERLIALVDMAGALFGTAADENPKITGHLQISVSDMM